MTRKRYFETLVAGVLLATSAPLFAAAPGEGISLNAATGNYDVTYCGIGPVGAKSSCILQHVEFEPGTKIDPILKSSFETERGTTISYRFAVGNGKRARQPLFTFVLEPISDIHSSQPLPKQSGDIAPGQLANALTAGAAAVSSPEGWRVLEAPSVSSHALRVAWMDTQVHDGMRGLMPGERQRGFGFASADLPGIVTARFRGNPAHRLAFPDEGPDGDIAQQLETLQVNDFVTAYAAVPSIPAPSPFDRAELLRRIDAQVKTWVDLKVLDAVVYSRIDRFIQAAISAAASGDLKSCTTHVGNVEKQLHEIYESLDDADDVWGEKPDSPLISRLAARVLEFDLGYALR